MLKFNNLKNLAILFLLFFNKILLKPYFYIFNVKCHNSARVCFGSHLRNVSIGAYSYISPDTFIINTNIGCYTSIAPGAKIGLSEHDYKFGMTSFKVSLGQASHLDTTIENDVWIGANAIIRQGLTISNGAVIGSGAVVLNNVDPYSIVVGVPAKHIKYRFDENTIKKLKILELWKKNPIQARSDLIKNIFTSN